MVANMEEKRLENIEKMLERVIALLDKYEPLLARLTSNPLFKLGGRR